MNLDMIKTRFLGAVSESRKRHADLETFLVAGEQLEKRHFPKLYGKYEHDLAWLNEQVVSIADAYHDGSVIAAAAALESDLEHG